MRKQHRSTTFSKMTISFVLFGLLPLLLLSFLFFYRYGSVTRENTLKSCSTMTAYIARSVGDVMENVDSALGSLYDYRSADGQSLAEIYDDADMPYGRKAQEVDAMLHEIMASSGYISSLRMVDAQGNVFSLYYNQDKTLNETGYERTTMEVFGETEDPTQLKLLGTVPEEEICVNSEDYVFGMVRNCMDTSSVETASSVPLATLFADINTDEIGKIIRSAGAAEGKFYVYGSLPQRYIYSDRPQRGGDPVPAGGLTGQRGCRICDAGILSQTRQPSPFLSVGLPASGGAAGKDQSVGANRQADLLRADSSAVWPHLRPQHVGQDCRLQPGGVGVDQEEKRLF